MSVFTNQIIIDPAALPVPVDGSGVTQPVSGTVTVSNPGLTDTQLRATPVPIIGTVTATGLLTDSQLRATPVPISGTVTTSSVTSNSATVAQVVLTGSTNTTLLAANANRKRAVIFAPKATLYLKFGTTASSTSFTYALTAANTTLEIGMWTGQIDVLSSVNQTVNVTELV